MNEKNFNSISQFEVPKSWIDGALDVPASHTKKPFPLIKLTRTLAAVACFVLVCGLSVALYFMTDDSSIPPVKYPDATESQFVDSSYNTDESGNNNSQTNEKTNNNSDSAETQVSSSHSHPEKDEDRIENGTGSHPEPNEKPQKPTTNKPDNTEPTTNVDNPTESTNKPNPPTPPFDPPIDEPTECHTDPPQPTNDPSPPVEPTVRPTRPMPTEEPTEEPTMDPPPWENPTVKPTTPTKPNYDDISIVENFGKNRVEAAINIYCAIYDSNGNLLGDSDLYASSHLTVKGISNGSRVYIHYYVYRMLEIPKSGTYTYVFYNSHGEEMTVGTCNLKADI